MSLASPGVSSIIVTDSFALAGAEDGQLPEGATATLLSAVTNSPIWRFTKNPVVGTLTGNRGENWVRTNHGIWYALPSIMPEPLSTLSSGTLTIDNLFLLTEGSPTGIIDVSVVAMHRVIVGTPGFLSFTLPNPTSLTITSSSSGDNSS